MALLENVLHFRSILSCQWACGLIAGLLISSIGVNAAPHIKTEGKKLRVTLENGDGYLYDTASFRVEKIWHGTATGAPGPERPMGILANPWQHQLRSLSGRWIGHEIVDDQTVFRYAVALCKQTVTIEERVALGPETVMLSFTLVHPASPFAMNYRMFTSEHRLVETTGQKRGRGQVQYLIDGQTEYQILVHLQDPGEKIPVGYVLDTIPAPTLPPGYLFEPSGLDVAKDGTLYVATRAAGIWTYQSGTWKPFADGLYDPLGLRVREDGVYVMQKPELTRLVDEDHDGLADRYETVSADFRFTANYHEFAYGPRFDSQGNGYFSLNLSADGNHKVSKSDGIQMTTALGFRGWVMQVSPEGKTTPYACGFRSPAGIGINALDEVFITDNQGDWVPSSYLMHVRPGQFHGHPASLLDTPQYGGGAALNYQTVTPVPATVPPVDEADFRKRRLVPTVWLPHEEYANSPGNPEFCTTAKFGPFEGQIFIGDVTKQSILRVHLEKVNGEYQGVVFPFVRPLPCGGFRLRFAPDGTLYVGELSRGWGGGTPGLQRLRWDGQTMPFEIQSVHLTREGFDLQLTSPLSETPVDPAQFEVQSFHYNYWALYGSERIDNQTLPLRSLRVAADRKTIHLGLPLEADRIYSVRMQGLQSDTGQILVNNSFCYTLNRLLPENPAP